MPPRNPMEALMQTASRLGGRESEADRIDREGQDAYELRVYRDCMRLATVFEEAEQLQNLLSRTQTFQQLRAVLKMYIIYWSTLWDAAANIIHDVLQLGLPERGISWSVVSKHSGVVESAILRPLNPLEARLERARFVTLRNDIVHRGWLVDPDYDVLNNEWVFTAVMATMHAPDQHADTVLEQVAQYSGIHEKLADLVRLKQHELAEHLNLTFDALQLLGRVLAAELRKRCAA